MTSFEKLSQREYMLPFLQNAAVKAIEAQSIKGDEAQRQADCEYDSDKTCLEEDACVIPNGVQLLYSLVLQYALSHSFQISLNINMNTVFSFAAVKAIEAQSIKGDKTQSQDDCEHDSDKTCLETDTCVGYKESFDELSQVESSSPLSRQAAALTAGALSRCESEGDKACLEKHQKKRKEAINDPDRFAKDKIDRSAKLDDKTQSQPNCVCDSGESLPQEDAYMSYEETFEELSQLELSLPFFRQATVKSTETHLARKRQQKPQKKRSSNNANKNDNLAAHVSDSQKHEAFVWKSVVNSMELFGERSDEENFNEEDYDKIKTRFYPRDEWKWKLCDKEDSKELDFDQLRYRYGVVSDGSKFGPLGTFVSW